MAEAGIAGPVLGISYDGTGYGEDGTVWGGEILWADRKDYRRVGYLRPVPLPGGEAAIRHPERMALSHLLSAFAPDEAERLACELMPEFRRGEAPLIAQQITRGINSPLTSSMGRLFDAAGALLGANLAVTYEGQPAMELEAMAEGLPDSAEAYPYAILEGVPDPRPMLRAMVADVQAGVSRGRSPHASTRPWPPSPWRLAGNCERPALPEQVALSGGVMQNARLVRRLVERFEAEGFQVYLHQEVPPNDGGLSLGQAVIAAARSAY